MDILIRSNGAFAYFSDFSLKTIIEVTLVLKEQGLERVLDHIELNNGIYMLSESIDDISKLTSYQFAIACTLASLGNIKLAAHIIKNPNPITKAKSGDNKSRELAKELKKINVFENQ